MSLEPVDLLDDGADETHSRCEPDRDQLHRPNRADVCFRRPPRPRFTFPFDEVWVLIVGQDPYQAPGHAVGLGFSVAPHVRPLASMGAWSTM